ncbi:MAG: DNA-directed RNA polymerase subunit omega [Thermodesulfobacteriota bacterium]|nr:DNA-directed RNA polymerase subunit omega [Thermodesulfobacteriota bacterium]
MARVTVEDCLKQEENRFLLIHLATKRVRQLLKGSKPLVNAPENKEIILALREIAAGKVIRREKPLSLDNHTDKSNTTQEEVQTEAETEK